MNSKPKTQNPKLVSALLDWFAANARDLPWRRTRDPYAIWVSEIMLQQTQVKTVIPYWERWMRELPNTEALAAAKPEKIHKLWEGLGYYTRVRNMQKAAHQIVASSRKDELHESQTKKLCRNSHGSSFRFPEKFDDVLALPGIGRYTAGAICSIAYNQPTPILDGNVIRVLTRVFGIAENPKEKQTNARLWKLAANLVFHSALRTPHSAFSCSHLNQSLMELGALVCTPRNAKCDVCPIQKLCTAFQTNRVEALPNLSKRASAMERKFIAFIVERRGKFLARQRPAGVVNAHLWEFPNEEIAGPEASKSFIAKSTARPFCMVRHSITRYRITLEAYHATIRQGRVTQVSNHDSKNGTRIARPSGCWLTSAEMEALPFSSAHRKILMKLRVV